MDLKVALCTIYNDNILDIKEWVEWNKNIGISKIFIYENNINNKKYESIKDYISECFVEIINIKSINNEINDLKSNCFIDFYEGQGKDYDWICFLDINDFLIFNDNLDLFSFLNKKDFINQDLILVSLENNQHFVKSITRSGKQILNKSQDNLSSIFRLENDNTIYSAGLRLRDKRNHYDIPNKIHRLASCYINNRYQVEIKENELKVAVCAIAKNENLYIREWVEWYKNLGISKIFLYDNNEIDGERFEEVINDYIESGFVEVINIYRGILKSQLNAYIDFYNNYSKYYDWCCFFDIDEFLTLTEDININYYLSRKCFNDFNSIAINWKNYGDNDLLGNENNYDRKCLSRFTKELNNPQNKYCNDVFKKIIRGGLRNITELESPHTFSPSLDKIVCNNCGEKINGKRYKCKCDHKLAYLKHFCTKTILEYILKIKRGGGVNGLTEYYLNVNNFFLYNQKTNEKENIINFYLDNKNNNLINLLVVNYNTPNLIDILIKNIKLQVKSKYHLYIFDNSDKYPCYKSDDENITIFDNTKGQIINFDVWLEQFPKRLECWSKNNGWGSAKHCYSVEKCFNLINDNFILLDSDILIKKDISKLYRNDLFYVGEISKLKTQNLPRISPYLCFINVNLCKLYNINYFYPEYMHGLSKNAHNYDTGGAFYKFVNKYQHLNITCDDYITHFGQGSWQETAKKSILKKTTTIDDWLKEYKYLYDETEFLRKNILEFAKNHYSDMNLNLDNPITIQDKINWLKIYDNNELKSKCADKILLHNYSEQILGKDICVPILYTYNTPEEINWNILPNKFIIKCNHGSGMNIIVKNKETINIEEISIKLNNWLNKDFSTSWGYEPQYKNIKHKILIEPYMSDNVQTDFLYDYKFWCFNGIPKFFTINGNGGHDNSVNINYYDMDKKPMYISRKNIFKADYNRQYKFPNNFDLMVDYAKKLSENFIFVRVDLYEINNTIYLGELTFTPASGFLTHTNKKYDKIIGDMLTLPIINKN